MFNNAYEETEENLNLSSMLLMDAIKAPVKQSDVVSPDPSSKAVSSTLAEEFISKYETLTKDAADNSNETVPLADRKTEDFTQEPNSTLCLSWWERLFARTSVGLEISHRAVRGARVRTLGKKREIERLVELELPEGRNNDPLVIAEYVHQIVRRLKAKSDEVVFLIGGNDITLRLVRIPKVSKNEIHGALLWKNKKELHFFNDAPTLLDYIILDDASSAPANELQLLVIAVKEDLVKNRLELLERADLLPGKLTLKAFAQWNFARPVESPGPGQMTIDIGFDSTHVSFFNDRTLQFAREIPIGGNDFTTALMQTIFVDQSSYLLTPEQAEQIKNEMGLILDPIKGKTAQGIPYSEIGVMMRPVAEKMAAEIKMSFDYYCENFKVKNLDSVWITGNGARLKNLTSFLEHQIGSPLQVLRPYERIGATGSVRNEDSHRLVACMDTVGAALSRGPELNFLPAKSRTELAFRKAFSGVVSAFIIVLIALAGLTFLLNKRNIDVKNIIQILKDSSVRQQLQSRECDALTTQINTLTAAESQLRQEIRNDSTMEHIMKLMSNITPEEIAIDDLTWGSDYNAVEMNRTKTAKKMEAGGGAAAPLRKNELRIRGSVYKDVFYGDIHLLTFIGALEKSRFFKEVILTEKRRDETDDKLFFEILSELKPKGNPL